MTLRPDLAIIAAHVARGGRVLDVGCGDGALMAALRDERGVDARGLEIGETLGGATVAQVVESMHPEWNPGDWVLAYGGWQDYAVADELLDDHEALRRLLQTTADGLPLTKGVAKRAPGAS